MKETCYNPCRCKGNRDSFTGSSEEISSDKCDTGQSLMSKYKTFVGESLAAAMDMGAIESDQYRSKGENLLSTGQCIKQRSMNISQDPLPSRPINIRPSDNNTSHGVESLCDAGRRQTPTLASQLGGKDRYEKDDRC